MRTTTILAVDDEPVNLDLIELAFAEMPGARVARAVHGRSALDQLAGGLAADVILLDLAMPVLDGFATLAVLKSDTRLARIPVVVVTANAEEKHRALAAGADDFLSKPLDIEELILRTRNHARLKEFNDYLQDAKSLLEDEVARRTTDLRAALALASDTEREICQRLGRAAEFRDLETGSHIRRMSHYAAHLARLAGLPAAEVGTVLHAAPLHDIGKIGVPDVILRKAAPLTPLERAEMQRHPLIGGAILARGERYPLIEAGRIIALQHHERFDGSGYPYGLAGEGIHVYGRLASIADVFDALTTRRSYKPAFGIEETLELMNRQRGTQFDPRLLDLFFGDLAAVLAIRDDFPDEVAPPAAPAPEPIGAAT
ncbi:MAG: response regulator [Vicinamibacterales bacterium]|nr:response regulator [Vicinamibacterales bacterium]